MGKPIPYQTPTIADAAIWEASEDEYHGDRSRWSNSLIARYLDEGPMYARELQQGRLRWPDSPALELGRLIHVSMLEPHRWAEHFHRGLVADWDARTTEGKKMQRQVEGEGGEWKTWAAARKKQAHAVMKEAQDAGKVIVDPKLYDKAEAVGGAVWDDAHRRDSEGDRDLLALLEAPGEYEASATAVLEGVRFRARADKIATISGRRRIVDLKSVSRKSPGAWRGAKWARMSALRYGYLRQDWLYRHVFGAALGLDGPLAPTIFVVVNVDDLHEVGVYHFGELDEPEMLLAGAECMRALRDIRYREESGDWLDPDQRGVRRLTLPKWAFIDEEERE